MGVVVSIGCVVVAGGCAVVGGGCVVVAGDGVVVATTVGVVAAVDNKHTQALHSRSPPFVTFARHTVQLY